MRFRYLKIGSIILAIILLASGCVFAPPLPNNPKDLVKNYVNYLAASDYNSAAELMSEQVKKETSKEIFTKAREQLRRLYGRDAFSSIKLTIVQATADRAQISVKLKGMNSEELTFNVIKENNDWKIGK